MKKLWKVCAAFTLCLSLAACGSKESDGDDKVITVGASASPHAEILEALKDQVEAKGYTLEVKIFDDYILPNTSVDEGELGANYFQHLPYLENFNVEHGTELASVAAIHFEPLGVYADDPQGKTALSLDDIEEGDIIAVPNDLTNEARALQLLDECGIIKLDTSKGLEATPADILENPKNIQLQEMKAEVLPSVLKDVKYAVINGNYALTNNISDKVIVKEATESEGAKTFANVLAVKKGNESSEKTKVLMEALQSDACRKFIEETYDGLVVPVF